MAKIRKRHLWLAARLLLFVLLGIALTTVAITARFWWQLETNKPQRSALTTDALKEKVEAYEKRTDQLDKMLELLLGVSTIYAVALSLSAYQQLKDSSDKIEDLGKGAQKAIDRLPDELKRLREAASKDIEDFALKVQGKFPLFADMDLAIGEIMYRLMHLLPVIDWRDEDYKLLTPQLKEEILFYEKTVAAFEYFDLKRIRSVRETASEIYHGLGNFYGLRFKLESHQVNDRERARFYLDRALRYNPQNSGALNDRGFLAVILDVPSDLAKAREAFARSIEVDAEQQRGYFDLANVEHAEQKYERAADLLTTAFSKKRWQTKLPARHRPSILYNRACAYARLGEKNAAQQASWFDKAIDDLKMVFPVGGTAGPELSTNFKNDIKPGEDLHALTLHQPWGVEMKEIEQRIP